MEGLGVSLCGNPANVAVSPKKFWQLYGAIGHLLLMGFATRSHAGKDRRTLHQLRAAEKRIAVRLWYCG